MISARDAGLVYMDHGRVVHACRRIAMDVHEDDFMGILGPSGSGKSSLLYLLSGLKAPSSGNVLYQGHDYSGLSERQRAALRLSEFGFVFQQPFLLGYLTALENVILTKRRTQSAAERAAALLEELGVADKAHRMPSELSGGEKQRVCVARALFTSPKVIFADEPTASLDHANGEQVVELLAEHRQGALVMVTHDASMLARAGRVFEIEEGVAEEVGAGVLSR